MMKQALIALRVAVVTLILTGLFYPFVVTALARTLFSHQATGSLVKDESDRIVGSELIGQNFSQPAYFQPRPSAAGTGYDALASGGSNLGTTSQKLRNRVTDDMSRLIAQNPQA
ncbi:MAG TPA: potassium-transporting ATPase subunit C, partial [Candidatus Sumerlaeota bacterium]|nr:potassium-transporting ATPase subunit C [Candidatus Sumerlaeota bacterium]